MTMLPAGPGLLEVGRVKALGEPAIDRRQQRRASARLPCAATGGQAHGGPEFQRFRLLTTGHVEGLLKARLGVVLIRLP